MIAFLKSFFAAAPGSVAGFLNLTELHRVIISSGVLGSLVAALVAFLTYLSGHLGTVLPNPTVAALGTMLISFVVEAIRRNSAGVPPSTPAN